MEAIRTECLKKRFVGSKARGVSCSNNVGSATVRFFLLWHKLEHGTVQASRIAVYFSWRGGFRLGLAS